MFKLTVVAGPKRGESFALKDGETSIGRQQGNVIVLPSAKVSKRHCVLQVQNEEIVVTDQGSSNGTFVNGVLSRNRKVAVGDRISVGDFVLEVSKPLVKRSLQAPAVAGLGGNVIQFPGAGPDAAAAAAAVGAAEAGSSDVMSGPPTDLKGKALWAFERYVMPAFYGFTFKYQWKYVVAVLFSAFIVFSVVVSVQPLMIQGRRQIVTEIGKRAQFMAKQIVDLNTAAVAAGQLSKTDIGGIDKEEGVRVAFLLDLTNRIIAPPERLNQYLSTGPESRFAVTTARAFREGLERGVVREPSMDAIAAIEPLKVLDRRLGKNVVVGMAIVSLDTVSVTPDIGELGIIYSETLILAALVGGLVLLILYRVTLKPFEVLNEDVDKVLKGEMSTVTREFKLEELSQLWDVINSALQRIPKGADGQAGAAAAAGPNVEDFTGPVRMLGDAVPNTGFVVFDHERKVAFANPFFEEISGIHLSDATGKTIDQVARDQSMVALCKDMMDQAAGGSSVTEDYEFTGVPYKMRMASFGAGSVKGFLLMAAKQEG